MIHERFFFFQYGNLLPIKSVFDKTPRRSNLQNFNHSQSKDKREKYTIYKNKYIAGDLTFSKMIVSID